MTPAMGVNVERIQRLTAGQKLSVALDSAKTEVSIALGEQVAADDLAIGRTNRRFRPHPHRSIGAEQREGGGSILTAST
jgi:hypothetical protein